MSIFYIVEVNGNYQLRLSANHFCVSSGSDVNDRFKVAENYLKKYKSKEGILKKLDSLTYGCSVPPTDTVRLSEMLKNGDNLFEDELLEIERKCEEFIQNNTPLKRTKKLLGAVLKKNTQKDPVEQKTQEIVCEIKRPKLFKRSVLI